MCMRQCEGAWVYIDMNADNLYIDRARERNKNTYTNARLHGAQQGLVGHDTTTAYTLQLRQHEPNDDKNDRRRRRHDAVRPEDSPADEPLERVPRRGLRDLRERQRGRRRDQQHVRHHEHRAVSEASVSIPIPG